MKAKISFLDNPPKREMLKTHPYPYPQITLDLKTNWTKKILREVENYQYE